MRRRTVTPLQLIKRIRSSRYSLPKRLYTMALLAQRLDQLCMAQAVEASSENQVNPAVGADPCAPTASQTPGTVAELNRWFQELSHLLHEQLLPKLKRRRLELTSIDELTLAQNYTLHRYFQEQLYPLLTPLAVDPGHPFPRIMAHNLHFLVTLQATVPFYRVHNTTTAFSPLGQFYHTPPRSGAVDENEIYGLVKISDHGPRHPNSARQSRPANEQAILCLARRRGAPLYLFALYRHECHWHLSIPRGVPCPANRQIALPQSRGTPQVAPLIMLLLGCGSPR
ncbi:MAG: hypothetical protein R2932_51095 [Caldilineaceae bacterium]